MSKQVAGKPEGATLLDAINDGEVEFPGRMTFMDWLKWRKSTGTRPLKKRDGVSTTLEEENVLWKEVMDFLHDAGEEELEGEEEEEEEEEQEADTAVELHLLLLTPLQGRTRASQTKSWRALVLPLWSFFQTRKGKLR